MAKKKKKSIGQALGSAFVKKLSSKYHSPAGRKYLKGKPNPGEQSVNKRLRQTLTKEEMLSLGLNTNPVSRPSVFKKIKIKGKPRKSDSEIRKELARKQYQQDSIVAQKHKESAKLLKERARKRAIR